LVYVLVLHIYCILVNQTFFCVAHGQLLQGVPHPQPSYGKSLVSGTKSCLTHSELPHAEPSAVAAITQICKVPWYDTMMDVQLQSLNCIRLDAGNQRSCFGRGDA